MKGEGVMERLCGAWLLTGVKPRQSFLVPNVGLEPMTLGLRMFNQSLSLPQHLQ